MESPFSFFGGRGHIGWWLFEKGSTYRITDDSRRQEGLFGILHLYKGREKGCYDSSTLCKRVNVVIVHETMHPYPNDAIFRQERDDLGRFDGSQIKERTEYIDLLFFYVFEHMLERSVDDTI